MDVSLLRTPHLQQISWKIVALPGGQQILEQLKG